MITLQVNGKRHRLSCGEDTPLLVVLRDHLGLKGAKYACDGGECGNCTVLVDGAPTLACAMAVGEVGDREVTTIEGLARTPDHPVIQAWLAEQVPQCGFCQPAMVLAASALLTRNRPPDDDDIDGALGGILCRCGTYARVRRAVHRAAQGGTVGGDTIRPTGQAAPTGNVVFSPNPWVRITDEGTVVILIDHSEMGQGVNTALATLVAEELDVDPARVVTRFAPAAPEYINTLTGTQMTAGSTSVREAWLKLRRAGAQARAMLVRAAAEEWEVPPGECRTAAGEVFHMPTARRASYAALAGAAAAQPTPEADEVPLKAPDQFRYLGRARPRLELAGHVTGATRFGVDIEIPDMLMAAVARCPVAGGGPATVRDEAARAVSGVRAVVPLENGVAVVADDFSSALRGRAALDIEWKEGANAGHSSRGIDAMFAEAAQRPGAVTHQAGDVDAALASGRRVIEAVYRTPYQAHAPMETMNCTARVGPGGCDVWVPTQAQTRARELAAEVAELPLDRVRIHTTFLGGGFGRRLTQDFVAEAVALAKAVGKPVQVQWTRADDMRHDRYRPANYTVLKACLDEEGLPSAWFQRTVGPALSLDGIDLPYAIPNTRLERVECDPGIPTGAWRSVGASQNAFVVEGFIDELAAEAGIDPLDYRRRLLRRQPRNLGVLDMVAERIGWTEPPPDGRHRGVARYCSYGSWVAEAAEVSVSRGGKIAVHRMVCAIDCGMTVNPDTIAAQIEGSVVFGLTAALKGEITFENGRVVQRGFKDYPLLTIAEMPEVEVHIVPSRESPGGVGEPGVPPVAPSVANAVYRATGRRLQRLPLRLP